MKIVYVNQNNIHLLKEFINNMGKASESFRYYNTRSVDIINNHLVTMLIIDKGKPVAYGHLDTENKIVWLGLCVLPGFQDKGYGKLIMTKLLHCAKEYKVLKINLTVDKVNKIAINLYERFRFQKENEFERCYKYSLVL